MSSFTIIRLNLIFEKKIFTINGRGCHLGDETWTTYKNCPLSCPKRLHMKFGIGWPSVFGERSLKIVTTPMDGRTGGRQCMCILDISSSCEPGGSGELICSRNDLEQ